MDDELLAKLDEARDLGLPWVLATIAETRGSVPRAAGAKMLVYADGRTFGTIGGGKLEALVVEAGLTTLGTGTPLLKTFPLHEGEAESFGAVCGGEVTVLIEPHVQKERLVLVGAGHCSRAIAKLAGECGLHVTVIDDRTEQLSDFTGARRLVSDRAPADFIRHHEWRGTDALVLVSRNHVLDRDALGAALGRTTIGYVGMIGSRRKVQRVWEELAEESTIDPERRRQVFAPVGLDIGADSPMEIAVSVMAEVLQVLRGRGGGHLRSPSV